MSELTRLLTQAAENLSGHPVKVRWRRPARADGRANCFKHNGVAIIDLHPGRSWDGDWLLDVLCHEAAHVKQLWDEWQGIPDLPSGSVTPPSWAADLPVVKAVENSADKQADCWMAEAERTHMQYIEPGGANDEFALKLRALSNMDRR